MHKLDLRVLILEDEPLDAELNKAQLLLLEEYNCIVKWVMNKADYLEALDIFKPDIILSDYNLPQYNGIEALNDLNARNLLIPFIVVTGTIDEETAAGTIKAGAWDYVVKDRLLRLPLAIRGALKLHEEKLINLESTQLNQKLSMALEQSPSHILITNTEGIIEYVNTRFNEVTGYNINELIGKTPRILNSGYHNKEFYNVLWTTIKSGQQWRGEFLNKRKDQSTFWEYASISPLKNSQGKITHYIAVKEDITLKKELEKEIIEARDRAERSDKLKEAFLQNISHEIRTPLNAIVGFSELLNEIGLEPNQINEYTKIIKSSSLQLLSIVNDILTISRIQTGQEKVNSEPTKINRILDNLLYDFQLNVQEKELKLNLFKGIEDKEFEFIADEVKLTQILSNLIQNAIKFTNYGKIEFGYNINDEYIQFFVKDTGIGISKELHDTIFDRFRQADFSISRNYGGTGLGLSISKSFIDLMKGEMWLESIVGEGTQIYFKLPVIKKNKLLDENKGQIKEIVEKEITILVAEDEEFNYLLIKTILDGNRFKLIHTWNGKETINIGLANSEIDLILMDIKMPEIDGIDAMQEIKKSRPNIPIIAITAYALEHEKEHFLRIGFNDYLPKPINKEELLKKVFKYAKTTHL